MTRLNIRKNLAFILHSTAQAVESIEVKPIQIPSVYQIRAKLAQAIAPKD